MDRGEFFGAAFKLVVGKALEFAEDNPVVKGLESMAEEGPPKEVWERPPGAHPDDGQFRQKCTGCDQCMIACPVNVIMIHDLKTRHPVIYPEKDPCVQCEGYPCVQACDEGALSLEAL